MVATIFVKCCHHTAHRCQYTTPSQNRKMINAKLSCFRVSASLRTLIVVQPQNSVRQFFRSIWQLRSLNCLALQHDPVEKTAHHHANIKVSVWSFTRPQLHDCRLQIFEYFTQPHGVLSLGGVSYGVSELIGLMPIVLHRSM